MGPCNILKFFILVFSLFSLSASAQNVSIKNFQNMKVEKIQGKELTLSFNTSFDNISGKSFGLNIKRGEIFKNGEYMGSYKLAKKIRIKNPGTQKINIKVVVLLDKKPNLIKEGLSMLTGSQPEIRVSGVFKATKFIFWKKYPFEFKEKVSMNNFMGK